MNEHPVHLHSIMVHAVIGLAPLAAAAFVLRSADVVFGSLGPDVWTLLLRGALAAILVIAVPSTVTGVSERNHMYATWHRTHRAKLWLSVALIALTGFACAALFSTTDGLRIASVVGAVVVVGNPIVVFLLSFYGLRITLGRQGLGRTSYVPDTDRTPPVDILEVVGGWTQEDAKLVDVLGEGDA